MKQQNGQHTYRFQKLWEILTAPHAADADEARREYMTKVICFLMGAVACGLMVFFGGGWVFGVFPLDSFIIAFVITVRPGASRISGIGTLQAIFLPAPFSSRPCMAIISAALARQRW